MVNALGFLGLILNLTSMAMKDILHLRFLSLVANSIYFVYGLQIGAGPIIVGSLIAVMIHAVSIYKLKKKKQTAYSSYTGKSFT